MEKINVAELLKDCPKGMELDCTMYEDVCFYKITDDPVFPVRIKRIDGAAITLTKYGEYADSPSAKCVIFPKGKTTWEGFQRPFVDGDIVFTTLGNIAIIRKPIEGELFYVYGIAVDNNFYKNEVTKVCVKRLATEEEKQKLFKAIKDNGYKWNPENKTLEKLPRFKVGDRITNGKTSFIIGYIDDEYYYENTAIRLSIKNQDEWELVPNKFDITTLVPFESRVLARDSVKSEWHPGIWGIYDSYHKSYPYRLIGDIARYCIPYEGNEHLLGKTTDCDEYFKTWD